MPKSVELDRIIHQPVRTKIIAFLADVKDCDYSTLKTTLGLSDGHMSTHMRELISNEYVEVKKEFINNKPKTTYRITSLGKKKLFAYVRALKQIVEFST